MVHEGERTESAFVYLGVLRGYRIFAVYNRKILRRGISLLLCVRRNQKDVPGSLGAAEWAIAYLGPNMSSVKTNVIGPAAQG